MKFLSEPSPRPEPLPVRRWVFLVASFLAGFAIAFAVARWARRA